VKKNPNFLFPQEMQELFAPSPDNEYEVLEDEKREVVGEVLLRLVRSELQDIHSPLRAKTPFTDSEILERAQKSAHNLEVIFFYDSDAWETFAEQDVATSPSLLAVYVPAEEHVIPDFLNKPLIFQNLSPQSLAAAQLLEGSPRAVSDDQWKDLVKKTQPLSHEMLRRKSAQTLLHELQHTVQDIFGVLPLLNELDEELLRKEQVKLFLFSCLCPALLYLLSEPGVFLPGAEDLTQRAMLLLFFAQSVKNMVFLGNKNHPRVRYLFSMAEIDARKRERT
jgi:hypothetical protein